MTPVKSRKRKAGDLSNEGTPFLFFLKQLLYNTSALRLHALRGLKTLHLLTRAFGPQFGEKLLLIFQVEYNIIFGISASNIDEIKLTGY